MSVPEISVQELQAMREKNIPHVVLDVRNADEYAICHLDGQLIPLVELAARVSELNQTDKIIVHCHAGGRSRRATELLMSLGFQQVFNLRGGITAWANEIDPAMAKY